MVTTGFLSLYMYMYTVCHHACCGTHQWTTCQHIRHTFLATRLLQMSDCCHYTALCLRALAGHHCHIWRERGGEGGGEREGERWGGEGGGGGRERERGGGGGERLGRRERERGGEERLGRRERERGGEERERGREVGRRDGGERHHMTTTVPCRGVSIIYIYNVHVHDVYTCSTFTPTFKGVCVCVSGCELIPERRGRREREGLG